MEKNKTISELYSIGQSIWYDNLSRDVLGSGELKRLVEQGVSGLTSNPTIFKKAIADSNDYDAEICQPKNRNLSPDDLCEELMVQDVGAAADLLRPIYESTGGADGLASIEVSPTLAHNSAETIVAAKRLWKKLSRPNVMIKIPATKEGIQAIEETIAEGINVNVTLIFSVAVYQAVAEAYIKGLEKRAKKGLTVDRIASVASFFVSRVDAICEKQLGSLASTGKIGEADVAKFFGKIGIANSKMAYAEYEKIFLSDRFRALEKFGARVQRPLWASTGTKNPKLSAVLYVEELAGKNTVNTVPPATLSALMKGAQAEPRLHKGQIEARELLANLEAIGVQFGKLLEQLQAEGVKSFADSYAELIESVKKKQDRIAS